MPDKCHYVKIFIKFCGTTFMGFPKNDPVLTRVSGGYPLSNCQRKVKFFDEEEARNLSFLSNNFIVPALVIAELYKCRWQVELFFKWIKQHLRIKAFYGTTENAVKTQIWIAVSVYVLVAIVKKQLRLKDMSLYTILQILSVTLFEKTPLFEILTAPKYPNINHASDNQLKLFEC